MKACRQCSAVKDLSEFHKDKTRYDGHRAMCKVCVGAYMKSHHIANRDKNVLRAVQWVENNRDKHNKKCNKWAKDNPQKVNARTARRYAAKTQATPSWLSADEYWMITEAYDLAKLREKMLGGKWEVDHIVPLRGSTVSGLHVPWNLQVISATVNRRKSNTVKVNP
jgi:5-methylcytosine-specific restriction endonuclease McrA